MGEDFCFESVSNTLNRWNGTAWVVTSTTTLNAKDFGAKGDGVTDDTAALVIALAAANAANAALSFPAGNYLTSPFVVGAAVRGLLGESRGSTTITIKTASYAGAARMIDARNNTGNLRIANLAIAVNNPAFDATWMLDLTGSNNAVVDGCLCTGSGAFGIIFQGGNYISVRNTNFVGTNGGFAYGIYGNATVAGAFGYLAHNVVMTGVNGFCVQFGGDGVHASGQHMISKCQATGSTTFGFSLYLCNQSHIEGCVGINTVHEAFQLTDTNYCSITNCVAQWTTGNGTDFGISINGTANIARFNKIVANTLVNSFKEGIACADWTQYALIEDNQLFDCGVRQGHAVFVNYTTTAGAQNNNNVFQHNQAVNDGGALTNYYLESIAGGGGAGLDGSVIQDNTFRGGGGISGAKYVTVGALTVVFDPEWVAWVPVVSSGTGTITSSTIGSAMYLRRGREIHLQLDITITNNGSGATSVNISLPINAVTSGGTLSGREVALNGITFAGHCTGASALLFKYDNTYPGGTNARLVASGVYRI